ncbi:MAG TPA: MarR family transcriptional regulator [Solirubrobacterales bacterium]|nr:MarR family transcriptional regulator [Solirubrobacterales bacterium]
MARQTDKKTADVAAEVWLLMSDLVLDQNRRRLVSEATGISFGHARAVRRVARRPMPMSELAAAMGIDPSNATTLVDRLEKEGLVRRGPDPNDRRTRLVEATRKGKVLARRAEDVLRTPPAALEALGPGDLEAIARMLKSVAGPKSGRKKGDEDGPR